MGKAYNVMAATCPSRTVLHRIGARWTVFVVNALADGPRRFTELKVSDPNYTLDCEEPICFGRGVSPLPL